MKMVFPLHPEFFRSPTHVTPEAIFKEALREVIVLPTLKTLERINVLFPRKDCSVPTTLRKLKKSWISKQHIVRISTAPTKYAVGYGSAELMADPTWTRLSVRVTCCAWKGSWHMKDGRVEEIPAIG